MASLENAISSLKTEKGGLFKKSKNDGKEKLTNTVSDITKSCIICEKLDSTMERYISVIFYLWKNEEEFKKKVINSKGFCLPHFNHLAEGAFGYLGKNKAAEFLEMLYKKELDALERLNTEVHDFTLMFDYRNAGKKMGNRS